MSPEIRRTLILYFCVAGAIAQRPPFEERGIADFDLRDTPTDYRLPNNTRPLEYELHISVDPNKLHFSGRVIIKVLAVEKSHIISLHHRSLSINYVHLRNEIEQIDIFPWKYDNRTQILSVLTNNVDLQAGEVYTLTIFYSGKLGTDYDGFYRTSYVNADGTLSYLATTHFEPIHARSAFPCYDEPAFRVNFTIFINHGTSYHAISNMPVASIERY